MVRAPAGEREQVLSSAKVRAGFVLVLAFAASCAPRAIEPQQPAASPAPPPPPSTTASGARSVSAAPPARAEPASRLRLGGLCTRKDFDACVKLAWDYRSGGHGPQNHARAVELLAAACDGGAAAGCRYLADYYASGVIVARDPAKAEALRRHADCEADSNAPCSVPRRRAPPASTQRSLEVNRADCAALVTTYRSDHGLRGDACCVQLV